MCIYMHISCNKNYYSHYLNWFSSWKCGPQTPRTSKTWELVRSSESQALPKTYSVRNSMEKVKGSPTYVLIFSQVMYTHGSQKLIWRNTSLRTINLDHPAYSPFCKWGGNGVQGVHYNPYALNILTPWLSSGYTKTQ